MTGYVHFAVAVAVFDDGSAITLSDDDSDDEERWVTIGYDALGGCWWLSIRGAARPFA
jgi:uncharacterized DUF497 family protein